VKKYKVIQWATGVVGSAALRGILRHPRLELAAVKVYSEAKEGRDAGDLIGAAKTGVVATRDTDCVLYCPLPWDTSEICRLLESGKHVVTPCPYWFPFVQNPEVAQAIGAAFRKGGVNFHASGCNPGGIAERFPLTFTGWCNRIDRIKMTECGDCTTYSSAGVMRELMNLGKTPEGARNNPLKAMLSKFWYEPIETAVGVIEKGTIALNHDQHIGTTREGTEIVQEQIWFVGGSAQTKLESKMKIPRESGWRISLEGDVNLNVDVDFPPELSHDQRVAQGLSTAGFHLVNAVPLVCEAPEPGIKTHLDLPMITGCLGADEAARR
jgi:hypothetical protein